MAAKLTKAQARRITLTAQALTKPHPKRVTTTQLKNTLATLGAVQIDSINVLTRSHYLPFFARLGPYATFSLDKLCATPPLQALEYWAHEAAVVTPQVHQLMGFRMQAGARIWGSVGQAAQDSPELIPHILGYLDQYGPTTGKQLTAALESGPKQPKNHWGWNWSTSKKLLEYLFYKGVVTSVGRTTQFERRYDLTERNVTTPPVISPDYDYTADIDQLVTIAVRAVGVGSLDRIADYFRLPKKQTSEALGRLTQTGQLQAATVTGLDFEHWTPADLTIPRTARTRALLSPFDSAVWHRPTLEQLYGIHHRLEVYVPAAKRVHGYYVLLFLLGDQIAARVDLKHDRKAETLRVQQVTYEPDAPDNTHSELTEELELMATWLGAHEVSWPR